MKGSKFSHYAIFGTLRLVKCGGESKLGVLVDDLIHGSDNSKNRKMFTLGPRVSPIPCTSYNLSRLSVSVWKSDSQRHDTRDSSSYPVE